jgi:hypothetical protein
MQSSILPPNARVDERGMESLVRGHPYWHRCLHAIVPTNPQDHRKGSPSVEIGKFGGTAPKVAAGSGGTSHSESDKQYARDTGFWVPQPRDQSVVPILIGFERSAVSGYKRVGRYRPHELGSAQRENLIGLEASTNAD